MQSLKVINQVKVENNEKVSLIKRTKVDHLNLVKPGGYRNIFAVTIRGIGENSCIFKTILNNHGKVTDLEEIG